MRSQHEAVHEGGMMLTCVTIMQSVAINPPHMPNNYVRMRNDLDKTLIFIPFYQGSFLKNRRVLGYKIFGVI